MDFDDEFFTAPKPSGHKAARFRGPLGDSVVDPQAPLAPLGEGMREAAARLVEKARSALEASDQSRADRFVQRAADLPYDDHDRGYPGLVAAHMNLYLALDHRMLFSNADEWVGPALTVYDEATGDSRARFGAVLVSFVEDSDIGGRARKKLLRVLESHDRDEVWDDPPTDREGRIGYIETLVRLRSSYERACDAAGLPDYSWLT